MICYIYYTYYIYIYIYIYLIELIEDNVIPSYDLLSWSTNERICRLCIIHLDTIERGHLILRIDKNL
jgi:hypothetical protein